MSLVGPPFTLAVENLILILFFQLLEFLEPLQIICGSSIMKIRELAALSISTILGKSGGNFNLEKFVVESLLEDRELSHNLCHGKILQVRKQCVVVVDY